MSEHGKYAEDLVERICKRMFLADFTVRGQAFKKRAGVSKEAADVLVPFEDTLIAFQVKSKRGSANPEERDEVYVGRVNKVLNEAIDQLKTVKRAVAARHLTQLRNAHGVVLPFDPSKIKNLIGIVIIDLPDEQHLPEEERLGLLNAFEYRYGIPVHAFMSEELALLAEELDTIPDFLDYLNKRELALRSGKIISSSSELDFLAYYKMHSDEIERSLNSDERIILLGDGIWEAYRRDHAAEIRRRDADNESSYLIDHVIEWLHTSIGFTLPAEPVAYQKPASPPEGTPAQIEQYVHGIIELARTPRLLRRIAGVKWLEKTIRAAKRGLGFSLIITRPAEALLLLSSDARTREQRNQQLFNIASFACCSKNLRKIVAVATEPAGARLRSFDVLVMNEVRFENADELRSMAADVFGAEQPFVVKEFEGTDE